MEYIKDKKYTLLRMLSTFLVTLVSIILIGYIISVTVPDVMDVESLENYIYSYGFFPEQSERMQYMVLTVLFPVIYIIIYKVLQNATINPKHYKLIRNVFICINLLLLLGLIGYILFTKIHLLKIFIIGIIAWIILAFLYKKIKKKNVIKICGYVVIACTIGLLAYLYIDSNYEQSEFALHHVDAYYYPISKIVNGMTPYIDFNPLYGCYSYIFALFETIFNNHTILFFSIITAVLIGIMLMCLSIVIDKVIRNKFVAFITSISVMFFTVLYGFILDGASYLQYSPHRIIFISIMLVYMCFYIRKRKVSEINKNILQVIGYLICSLAIFWNVEMGLVALIAWTGVLFYETLFFNSLRDKKTYLSILKFIIFAICSILIVYISIALITYIRTHEIVSISSILFSQTIFYKNGYMMIKMELWKPWMLTICTYMVGLACSLRKLFIIDKTKRTSFIRYAMMFAISILGIGIFIYYQGRSHDNVYITVLYPSMILMGLFADMLLRNNTFTKDKFIKLINRLLIIICAAPLCSITIMMYYTFATNDTVHVYLDKPKLFNIKHLEDFAVLEEASIIDMTNVDFISNWESLYYKKFGLKDEKRMPAVIDMFTYDDCEKVLEYLDNTEKDVIMAPSFYDILVNKYGKERFKKFTIGTYNNYKILLNNKN